MPCSRVCSFRQCSNCCCACCDSGGFMMVRLVLGLLLMVTGFALSGNDDSDSVHAGAQTVFRSSNCSFSRSNCSFSRSNCSTPANTASSVAAAALPETPDIESDAPSGAVAATAAPNTAAPSSTGGYSAAAMQNAAAFNSILYNANGDVICPDCGLPIRANTAYETSYASLNFRPQRLFRGPLRSGGLFRGMRARRHARQATRYAAYHSPMYASNGYSSAYAYNAPLYSNNGYRTYSGGRVCVNGVCY